jgi:16S rRNA (uracil1498-N3)-methyltransferase
MNEEKHIFSLYTHRLPAQDSLSAGNSILISDIDIWHRTFNVLHLEEGDQIIVFDGLNSVQVSVTMSRKKGIFSGIIQEVLPVVALLPKIHLYQGLLRREAFDEVAYFAAQMGVTTFTPVLCKKVQRGWGGAKEIDRLRKVMIAACEQSKQFILPCINDPVDISSLRKESGAAFFCEDTGDPFFEFLQNMHKIKPTEISIAVGPEGGFTLSEQDMLKSRGFSSYALTPSILRSQEAVAVCVGAIRSVCR